MLSRTRFVLGLALVFAIATLVVMSGSQAQQPTGPESGGTITGLITSVPRTMSYQAILYDIAGNPVRNTTLDVTFRIYDAYTGGNELWMEVVQVTTDRNGNFTAILGENIPLNLSFDTDYWMSLQVGGDPEMVPRLKLHMVPYSARTDTSDYAFSSLSGGGWVDDGTVVRLENSTDYVGIGTTSPQGPLQVGDGTFIVTGQNWVGIGTTNPGANLHIAATSAGSPVKINIDAAGIASAANIRFENGGGLGKAEIWYDIASEKFTVKAISPGSVLNLWGRDNDGISVDQHGDVGIGTTTPTEKLDVEGNIIVSGKATIGPGHTNTGANAFVAGQNNTASGDHSAVGGGTDNVSTAPYGTVGGGMDNLASGAASTVGGGYSSVADGHWSAIGGGTHNIADQWYATVSGGRSNRASGQESTVGGGSDNIASGGAALVGGGGNNTSSGTGSTVGGGMANTTSGHWSTVSGGRENIVSESLSTVGGGGRNTASGAYSVIPGRLSNVAGGDYSFATGRRAKANHNGAFVWADSTNADFASTGDNQYLIRAGGGVGIGTTSPQGALDVNSTTGAFIVPRMTTAQRDALTAVNGMIVYNTTTNQFNFYENGAW